MNKKTDNYSIEACYELLSKLPDAQQQEYQLWLQRLKRRANKKQPIDRSLKQCFQAMQKANSAQSERLFHQPKVNLNQSLPIFTKRDELVSAIQNHQVLVVAGETGSGKTTQLPQLCLLAGRGQAGIIGHTQPRRLAARSVASRIAEELQTELGKAVGYQVRFDKQVSDNPYIKLMTDGILLNELHDDPLLRKYDTLIIDEAHERSLNIDFILGLLKNILAQRDDLKIIITSATIDLDKFSHHFNDAPIIQVSGRTFPVEVRYRTFEDYNATESFEDLALHAVNELIKAGPGDCLIFLPTEQSIRHLADHLRRRLKGDIEILPLYSRLAQKQQMMIFGSHHKPRIVLSTNIAETSLTVPGIKYVIDSGLARISRYSTRSKVQRLPVEPISQASANQRMGRCGRLEDGICIRLYSEDDFLSRSEFILPEILRTNLASVILQMTVLELGNIEQFDFIDAPEQKQINDGVQLLKELGAMDDGRRITKLGRQLAKLPLDPRIARILVTASKQGALKEVIILAAAIGLPDPRERPLDKQQQADEMHQRFRDKKSDFSSMLKLWDYFHDLADELSWNKVRKQCLREFIHFNRMREWREQVAQLTQLMKRTDHTVNTTNADYEAIHKALLSGFVTQVALHDPKGYYLAPRQIKVHLFPGSGLFIKKQHNKNKEITTTQTKTKPASAKWIMAAELVETSKLYARQAAEIKPEWIEQASQGLLKIQNSDPYWSTKMARAMVKESGLLYGLTIYSGRAKPLANTDPIQARQMFITDGILEKGFRTSAKSLINNWNLLDEVEQMEQMSRRRDLLVSKDWLADFYQQRIPEDINNGPAFDHWYRKLDAEKQQHFGYNLEDISPKDLTEQRQDFPKSSMYKGMPFELHYVFEPGREDDGLHIKIPLLVLNQVDDIDFEWLVPGLIKDKITALIRGLPKAKRKNFVPVPNYVDALVQSICEGDTPLHLQISSALKRMTGVAIEQQEFDQVELPINLKPVFVIIDEQEAIIDESRDLSALQNTHGEQVQSSFAQQDRQQVWQEFPDTKIEKQISIKQSAMEIPIYQGLKFSAEGVELVQTDSEYQANYMHRNSIINLLLRDNNKLIKELSEYLKEMDKVKIAYAGLPKLTESTQHVEFSGLYEDLICLLAEQILDDTGLCYEPEQYTSFQADIRAQIFPFIIEQQSVLNQIFEQSRNIRGNIDKPKDLRILAVAQAIKLRLNELMYQGFIHQMGETLLSNYPRYIKGVAARLETALNKPEQERARAIVWDKYWQKYLDLPTQYQTSETRMTLEEFHISLFAQQLGTKVKVSEKRLEQMFKDFAARR